MHLNHTNTTASELQCESVRSEFSGYLDGVVTGVEMAAIAQHLENCPACAEDFESLRMIQAALADLGPAKPPVRLQARLRSALAVEREQGTYLSVFGRFALAWRQWLASAALRVAGGATAAVVLLGSAAAILSGPLTVQADDDRVHLTSPMYLYSQVPPRPLETGHEVPVLVDAQVDARGRVYDYSILAGPMDSTIKVRVEENLLSSVFKPATAFGTPVRGHVLMTYSGVSVRG